MHAWWQHPGLDNLNLHFAGDSRGEERRFAVKFIEGLQLLVHGVVVAKFLQPLLEELHELLLQFRFPKAMEVAADAVTSHAALSILTLFTSLGREEPTVGNDIVQRSGKTKMVRKRASSRPDTSGLSAPLHVVSTNLGSSRVPKRSDV